MTAYASRASTSATGQLTWEIRSVNQRYLDLNLRLPEDFRMLEADIRARFKARLNRGKLEATLRFQLDPGAASAAPRLNEPLAQVLLDSHKKLASMATNPAPTDLVAMMAWPGILIEQRPEFDAEREQAMTLLDDAIDALIDARAQEGQAITGMLEQRLNGIEQQLAKVRAHLPAVRQALRQRYDERLSNLGTDLDPGRLEQEIALQLTKLDVDEELDRLDAHVAEIRRVLGLEEPIGRRLDFLMQELNREANTLGSKAVAAETTGVAVELKVLIEQMREQVQNVE
ncbi:MAG: YicC/YloC family endoribonuclease [Pseudomonadota bacterium]